MSLFAQHAVSLPQELIIPLRIERIERIEHIERIERIEPFGISTHRLYQTEVAYLSQACTPVNKVRSYINRQTDQVRSCINRQAAKVRSCIIRQAER